MRHKIYRRLNRCLCALLGHPLWSTLDQYDARECGCGAVYVESTGTPMMRTIAQDFEEINKQPKI